MKTLNSDYALSTRLISVCNYPEKDIARKWYGICINALSLIQSLRIVHEALSYVVVG